MEGGLFKFAARIWVVILAVTVVLSLGFNVAVVGFASVTAAVSGIYDAVTGTASAYSSVKERARKAEADAADLVVERNRLKEETLELIDERDRAVSRSSELFEQVEARDAQNARLTDDILENEAHIARLEEDIEVKKRKISSLSSEVELRESKIAELSDDLRLKDTRIANLSDDAAKRADDAVRYSDTVLYRGSRQTLAEAVVDTNGRIAKRTATAATRNASSVFAEAIPYLGIAAMLGVTAYDLKDSCDTIKDLHALDVAIDPAKEFGAEETEICGLSVPTMDEVWQQVKTGSEEVWLQASEQMPSLPEYELPSWRDLMFGR